VSLHDLHILFWIAFIGALTFILNLHLVQKMKSGPGAKLS